MAIKAITAIITIKAITVIIAIKAIPSPHNQKQSCGYY